MNSQYYEELYNKNKSLVSYVISKMSFKPETYYLREEMIAAGFNGLNTAVHKYNPNKYKSAFSSFAFTCIKNEILHYLKRLKRSHFQFNLSLNEIFEFDDELDKKEEFITNLSDDVQARRDEVQSDKDTVQDVLAAIVTCANKRDQEIFIRCEILGYYQAEVAEIFNISWQIISLKINRIRQRVKEIISYMENKSNAPHRKDYINATEWRKAYAQFYLKNRKHKRYFNKYYEESPLINQCFPCVD